MHGRHSQAACRRALAHVDTLVTLVVRIERASADRHASSRCSRCEIGGRDQDHRSSYALYISALSSTEVSNRIWDSRNFETRRAAWPPLPSHFLTSIYPCYKQYPVIGKGSSQFCITAWTRQNRPEVTCDLKYCSTYWMMSHDWWGRSDSWRLEGGLSVKTLLFVLQARCVCWYVNEIKMIPFWYSLYVTHFPALIAKVCYLQKRESCYWIAYKWHFGRMQNYRLR